MKVKVLRQLAPGTEPYWETFDADVPGDMTVAGLLDHLNYHDDIVDENGKKTTRIGWACSCLQGVCGACAMVINGTPALACETFVRDCRGDVLTIEPLKKFPVIHDLVIDRSVIYENLKQTDLYIEEYQPAGRDKASAAGAGKRDGGKRRRAEAEYRHQYAAARCLKCGLCLEVCPNYTSGEHFYGALFANDCYLVAARNSRKTDEIRRAYGEHFAAGCSKSLSCMDVCPMQIQTIASMAGLNRSGRRRIKHE